MKAEIIKVEIKTSYGVERIVPLCDRGRIFADIAGQKTLTRQVIDKIKALGFVIEVVPAVTHL